MGDLGQKPEGDRQKQGGRKRVQPHGKACERPRGLVDLKGARGADPVAGGPDRQAARPPIPYAQSGQNIGHGAQNAVRMTGTAVSDGSPPSFSVIPIATGAVTDCARAMIVSTSAPRCSASITAVTTAIADPARRLIRIAAYDRFRIATCLYNGIANATVAGPSKK